MRRGIAPAVLAEKEGSLNGGRGEDEGEGDGGKGVHALRSPILRAKVRKAPRAMMAKAARTRG